MQVHFVPIARETEEPGQESGRDLGIRGQEWNENETRGRLLLPLLLFEVTRVNARTAAQNPSLQFLEATVFAILENRNHGWRPTALFGHEL